MNLQPFTKAPKIKRKPLLIVLAQLVIFVMCLTQGRRQRQQLTGSISDSSTEEVGRMVYTIMDNPGNSSIVSRPIYPVGSKSKPTTFLLGIFSTSSKEETARRDLIRRTMLDRNNLEDPTKLCSLLEFMENIEIQEKCQIIYTFVIGGASSSQEPFWSSLLDQRPPRLALLNITETDITFLNIKENMDQGKSTTWFDFASYHGEDMIMPQVDYIGKADSDTLINITSLSSLVDDQLPTDDKDAVKVYGGKFVFPSPPYKQFMQGAFYFLSRTLAQCISSKAAESSKFHGPEDQRTAWMVLQCSAEWLMLCPRSNLFTHPLKEVDSWMHHFQKLEIPSVEQVCLPNDILKDDLFLKRFSDRNLYYGMEEKDPKSAFRSGTNNFATSLEFPA